MRTPRSGGDDMPSGSFVPSPQSSGQDGSQFGTELRRLRLRAGLARAGLAERAEVSLATLAALEGGQRRRPPPHTVVALANALGRGGVERTAFLELAGSPAVQSEKGSLVQPPAPKRPVARVRLPIPPTALIGREADVATAAALLDPASSTVRLL